MRNVPFVLLSCALSTSLASLACSKSEKQNLAPTASALASAAPVTKMSKTFVLDPSKSSVSFSMEAELERISGKAPESAQGELFIDFKDLAKSTGLVKIDLDKLSIYKKVRKEGETEFGEEEKNEKQNRDMRNWFQIGEDAPADDREKYRWVEFKITKVDASPNDVTSLSGPSRKVEATVIGDFRMHGRVTKKSLPLELEFKFDGDEPTGLAIRSSKPFAVGLEEHDVKPRKSFAELADATLDALGKKVAKVAMVTIDATASPK